MSTTPITAPPGFTLGEATVSTGAIPIWSGGNGRPILYLHNGGGLRLSPALAALAESFRIVAPILPGFDGTPLHRGVGAMTDLADLAAELIAWLGEEPCDVIGHSFGGWVAAWLAVRHPHRTDQLVLEAPAGFGPEEIGWLDQDPAKLAAAVPAHLERLGADERAAEICAVNRGTAQRYRERAGTDPALVARLGEIQSLTLILAGTRDGVTRPETCRLLKAAIPRSYLTFVYDAAHAIEVDQPLRFVRVVRDFLTRGEAFIIHWTDEAPAEDRQPV